MIHPSIVFHHHVVVGNPWLVVLFPPEFLEFVPPLFKGPPTQRIPLIIGRDILESIDGIVDIPEENGMSGQTIWKLLLVPEVSAPLLIVNDSSNRLSASFSLARGTTIPHA